MSEKHLTELPWKTLVTKTKIKDTGLQKALAAYGLVDCQKDASKGLEALEEIIGQAIKLKKANSAQSEVTDYLDEVTKEVARTKPRLAAQAKTQQAADAKTESQGESEPEAEGSDIKSRLLGALKKIKAAKGEASFGFVACVAKPCYGLLFAKSPSEKIGATHRKELTDLTQGTKFILGSCLLEQEAYTFVVDAKDATGALRAQLKKSLKESAGLVCKVRVRDMEGNEVAETEGANEEAELSAEAAGKPNEATAEPAAASAPAPAQDEALNQFTTRFKGLQSDILKAVASKTPSGDTIKLRASEAGTFARSGNYARANKLLDEVEQLLKTPAAAPSGGTIPPIGQAAPKPAAEAQRSGPATTAQPGPQKPAKPPTLSAYMNTTKEWREAKKAAANGIFALKNAIFAACDPELSDLVKTRIDQLNSILNVVDDTIIAKIQDAGSEGDEERQSEQNRALAEFAAKQLAALRSHPLAAVADTNPFGTFKIRGPLEGVLTKISTTFAA